MKFKFILVFSLLVHFSVSLFTIQFQQVRGTNVVFFCQAKDVKYAHYLIKKVDDRISNFQETIGFYPDKPLSVVIAPDKSYYNHIAGQIGPIGEESQALFTSAHNIVYIRSPRDASSFQGIDDTIMHEYLHYFVNMNYYDAPLWFHEGMAVYFSGQYNWEMGYVLAKSYLIRTAQPLSEMNRYPENRLEWQSFYAKSAMAVRYLFMEHRDQFTRFWQLSERTHSFPTAFYQAFFYTLQAFGRDADDTIKRQMIGYMILVISGLLWAALPIVLVLGYFRKRTYPKDADDDFEKRAIENGEDYWNQPIEPEEEPDEKGSGNRGE